MALRHGSDSTLSYEWCLRPKHSSTDFGRWFAFSLSLSVFHAIECGQRKRAPHVCADSFRYFSLLLRCFRVFRPVTIASALGTFKLQLRNPRLSRKLRYTPGCLLFWKIRNMARSPRLSAWQPRSARSLWWGLRLPHSYAGRPSIRSDERPRLSTAHKWRNSRHPLKIT
jgi:hypothetical protein